MSDSENQSPAPSKQTSSVPLKKETVRVTLNAADAPQAPSATVPAAPPVAPPTPTAAVPPKPPTIAPAPTIPLKTAPAPTVPLRAPAPAASAAPPTIKLSTSTTPLRPATPTTGPGALPGAKPVGASPTLPKATVQLQPPTTPIGRTSSPSQSPTLRMEELDEDVEPHEGLLKVLSWLGFAAALGLLATQISVSSVWINSEDQSRKGDWSRIIE